MVDQLVTREFNIRWQHPTFTYTVKFFAPVLLSIRLYTPNTIFFSMIMFNLVQLTCSEKLCLVSKGLKTCLAQTLISMNSLSSTKKSQKQANFRAVALFSMANRVIHEWQILKVAHWVC